MGSADLPVLDAPFRPKQIFRASACCRCRGFMARPMVAVIKGRAELVAGYAGGSVPAVGHSRRRRAPRGSRRRVVGCGEHAALIAPRRARYLICHEEVCRHRGNLITGRRAAPGPKYLRVACRNTAPPLAPKRAARLEHSARRDSGHGYRPRRKAERIQRLAAHRQNVARSAIAERSSGLGQV